MKIMLITAVVIMTASSFASTKGMKVVYGDDNRVDVINSTNSMYVELSKSTAAMVPKHNLSVMSNGDVKLRGSSLESRGMCKTERFSQQPTTAMCSGFLVGEDLLVTAGHCITSMRDCSSNSWVFDYKVSHNGQTQITVPQTSVYSCKKIISRELSRYNQNDYALIQLDRKVTDRRVLAVRQSGQITRGEDLVVIGHPTGLPTKIADGAKVKSLSGKYFSANLDTYGGNSGSAVFNANTGIVEGILVRGATDYVYDSTQGCRITNFLGNNEGRGEDVTFITNIKEL
jgi:V8-like Glu-specific endopeptidase